MAALLVKHLPTSLHQRLRASAKAHRRSMNQEAIILLEDALARSTTVAVSPPPPMPTRRPLSDAWLRAAIRKGRA